jgi:hypothetical protein
MKVRCIILGAGLMTASVAPAQSSTAVPGTIDNFGRAETDIYMGVIFKRTGNREVLP